MARLTKIEKETIVLFNEGRGQGKYLHPQRRIEKEVGCFC